MRGVEMRKLIMWNLVSVDGFFEGEKAWDLNFHSLAWGKELEDISLEQLQSADMLIFGKETYVGMADYWPKAESEVAEITKIMNKIRKVVCSRTLNAAGWNNTTIVRNAVAEVPKLKQEGDGNMFVFGSSRLSESLFRANLIDECRICVVPVILGKGRRLFRDGVPYQKLTLLEARPLQTGGIILRYAPVSK